MKSRRSWWTAFGLCIGVVLAALVWVTVMALRLERAEAQARAQAGHQEALRLAMWRMDSWLAPLLAREAARPYFDYQSFYPQQRAYTTLLSPIEPGEVLAPSPLLAFESEYFTLHYQIAPDGGITSPQAPVGAFQDLAVGSYLSNKQIEANRVQLAEISSIVSPDQVAQCVAVFEAGDEPGPEVWNAGPIVNRPQQARSVQEFAARKGAYQQSQLLNIEQLKNQTAKIDSVDTASAIDVGILVPFWTTASDGPRLVFTRRIRVNGSSYYQGFVCNWERLQETLLGQIADLFPAASLVPVPGGPADSSEAGSMLATIPVALAVADPIPVVVSAMSPFRWTLLLTWAAVLAGSAAVAVTLQASIAFGQKRSRFASAVTHELRTPLTTFQMYTEMLAEGMVADEDKRREYLDTLHKESTRLSNLVENVMAYARLEEGRGRPAPQVTTLGAVLDHVVPALEQRAKAAGMVLTVENGLAPETSVRADLDAVGQVLGNLVDNSCKYATGADDTSIKLAATIEGGRVVIRVRDHGPGIPRKYEGAIFSPFDRGRRDAADPVPGLGLGLALSRGLARDLGGDLELERSSDGACFRLTLPG